jgi:hypothetical protein
MRKKFNVSFFFLVLCAAAWAQLFSSGAVTPSGAVAGETTFRIDVSALDKTGKVKFSNGSAINAGKEFPIGEARWRPEADRPYSLNALFPLGRGAIAAGAWHDCQLIFTVVNDGVVTLGLGGEWAQLPDNRAWVVVGEVKRDGAVLDFSRRAFDGVIVDRETHRYTNPQNIDGFHYARDAELLAEAGLERADGTIGAAALCNHDNLANYTFWAQAGKTYTFDFRVKAEAADVSAAPQVTMWRTDLSGLEAQPPVKLTSVPPSGAVKIEASRWRPEAERPFSLTAVATAPIPTAYANYEFAFKPENDGVVLIACGAEWAQKVEDRAWLIIAALTINGTEVPLFTADLKPEPNVTVGRDCQVFAEFVPSTPAAGTNRAVVSANHDHRLTYRLTVKGGVEYQVQLRARPSAPAVN